MHERRENVTTPADVQRIARILRDALGVECATPEEVRIAAETRVGRQVILAARGAEIAATLRREAWCAALRGLLLVAGITFALAKVTVHLHARLVGIAWRVVGRGTPRPTKHTEESDG